MPTSKAEDENQPKTEEPERHLPCMHDPRRFINCMNNEILPPQLRRALEGMTDAKFVPTCAFYAIHGSHYCRPHTVMNGAVTPAIRDDIDTYLSYTMKAMASGYVHCIGGTLYREVGYPHQGGVFIPSLARPLFKAFREQPKP